MKGLKVNMNYVSCFLLCVILILMVVCCFKKPTEDFGDIKCTKYLPRWLGGACQSYSCLTSANPKSRKWRSCGHNSNSYCTKKRQVLPRHRQNRVRECRNAPAYIPAPSPQEVAAEAAAAAEAIAASSIQPRQPTPTPWLELSDTELKHADILLNFLTLISVVDFGKIYSEQHLIHEDWQILTEGLINNVKLIVNGNRGEDFFEYLMHGQPDPFAPYNGNVLFTRDTFGKNVMNVGTMTNRRWDGQATAATRLPPTKEQDIILNQVSSYMDYWTSGQRGQNYVRPTRTKDVFGNYPPTR